MDNDKRNPLQGLNLNLFPVLSALLRHRSVKLAAKELGVTPSAVSHSLRDIRAIVGDPLFVRTRDGLVPTPRALALESPIARALALLGESLAGSQTFEASESERQCVLMSADDSGRTILPALSARLAEAAPKVVLNIKARRKDTLQALERGDADLVLDLERAVPSWVGRAHLYSDTMVALVRRDAPFEGDFLSLETYLGARHVRVSPEGYGPSDVDTHLAKAGHTRQICVYSPSFLLAPELIPMGNALLTLPSKLAETYARTGAFRILELPFEVGAFSMSIYWDRSRDDAFLAWIRSELLAAASELPQLTGVSSS